MEWLSDWSLVIYMFLVWTVCSFLGIYIFWYFHLCPNASYLKSLLSIFIVVFQLCPFKCLGLSLSLPNNTDANASETPGASSGSWSPLKTSVPTIPSPGPNFPGTKPQGPQLSSLFSSSECECVSDRMVMSIPQIEHQPFPPSAWK